MSVSLDSLAFNPLPCAHCDEHPKPRNQGESKMLRIVSYGSGWAILCTRCGARSPRSPSPEEAIVNWNDTQGGTASTAYRLVPDHDCVRVFDFSKYLMPGRTLWVGKITRPPSGYDHESVCIHLRTPEKPELGFCLNRGDVEFLHVLSYAVLGEGLAERWMDRIADAARTSEKTPPLD